MCTGFCPVIAIFGGMDHCDVSFAFITLVEELDAVYEGPANYVDAFMASRYVAGLV